MLAGDGTSQPHGGSQDIGPKQLAAAHLVRLCRVKQDQWMQIAVSGMKNVDTTQAVLALHLLDRAQHLRQSPPGYGGIHAHVVRADAAGRRESVLAAAPKLETLRFVAADLDSRCPRGDQHLLHSNDLLADLLGSAVTFAQQNSCMDATT